MVFLSITCWNINIMLKPFIKKINFLVPFSLYDYKKCLSYVYGLYLWLILLFDTAKLENNPKINLIKIHWPKGGKDRNLRKKKKRTTPCGN